MPVEWGAHLGVCHGDLCEHVSTAAHGMSSTRSRIADAEVSRDKTQAHGTQILMEEADLLRVDDIPCAACEKFGSRWRPVVIRPRLGAVSQTARHSWATNPEDSVSAGRTPKWA